MTTDEVFIRFVEAVAAPRFAGIDFCSRVLTVSADRPYALPSPPFRIVALPWYEDVPALCLRAPWLLPRIARRLAGVLDGCERGGEGQLSHTAMMRRTAVVVKS